jgi:GntR family transcriptional regulator/MocR family aminotransferase
VDSDGLIVERLPPETKIICLCPSHQFPLGMSMSPERRTALIAFARRNGALIVEDDYDGEFRHTGDPLGALISEDAADVVFYVGSFSKCMTPSLRLGYLIAPRWAMSTLVAAKNCLDWHCPSAMQAGVAAFIIEGHLTRHLRKMRKLYRERRDTLLEAVAFRLGSKLEAVPSRYGMHVSAVARGAEDLDRVSQALLCANVRLHSLSRYYLGPADRQGLVFGLGVATPAEIWRGVEQVRALLDAG